MSQSNAKYEADRWWRTAQDDIEAAQSLHEAKKFSHACFLSQQSAEKAMKALWFAIEKAKFFLEETHKLLSEL